MIPATTWIWEGNRQYGPSFCRDAKWQQVSTYSTEKDFSHAKHWRDNTREDGHDGGALREKTYVVFSLGVHSVLRTASNKEVVGRNKRARPRRLLKPANKTLHK